MGGILVALAIVVCVEYAARWITGGQVMACQRIKAGKPAFFCCPYWGFRTSKKISDFFNLGIDFFILKVYYIGVERAGAKAPRTNERRTKS